MQDVSWEVRYEVAGLVGALAAARRTDSSGLHLTVAGPMIDRLAELCGIEPYKLPDEDEREGAELDAVASRKAPEAPEADRAEWYDTDDTTRRTVSVQWWSFNRNLGLGSTYVTRREHPGTWSVPELVGTENVTRAWALGFAARYLSRHDLVDGAPEWRFKSFDDAADYHAGYAAGVSELLRVGLEQEQAGGRSNDRP